MKKLNKVLETSIKSSYRTRYEYNLNDYKKNFILENDDGTEFFNNNMNNKREIIDNLGKDNYDDEENVIYSKRFYSEKNPNLDNKNLVINKFKNKEYMIDKNFNFQNTLNLKNKIDNIAEFEEIQKNNPYKSNLIHKSDGTKNLNLSDNDKNISNNPYRSNPNNFHETEKYQLNQTNESIFGDINFKKNILKKNNLPINNFSQLNYQFESFNVNEVLKTADNLGKNNYKNDKNYKRVDIPNKVFDIDKLRKTSNINFKDEKNDISTTDHNSDIYQDNNSFNINNSDLNKHYFIDNSHGEKNFLNTDINSFLHKKEEDSYDYLKNLLMKTQIEIQNFNNEFDNNSLDINLYKKNSNKNLYSDNKIMDIIPRKEPKPSKPII